jgi:hypothetical protein
LDIREKEVEQKEVSLPVLMDLGKVEDENT